MQERIQKILSRHGVASRRDVEEMLKAGRISVNGELAAVGQKADDDVDAIEIDGVKLAPASNKVYIILYKPRGFLTAVRDDRGRRTVVELVESCGQRVYPVGRLDLDSEGLLIMTNDGELTNILTHPSNEKVKTYRVYVVGDVDHALGLLRSPLTIDGYRIRPAEVNIMEKQQNRGVLSIAIHEGRNRQIRKMCACCGLKISRLIRVAEGGIELGNLAPGEWRYLTDDEVELLYGKKHPPEL